MSDQFQGIDEHFDPNEYDAYYSDLIQSIQGFDMEEGGTKSVASQESPAGGESDMDTIYLFPPSSPTVEPHRLIKAFEQDFEAKVKKPLDEFSREANKLLFDLRNVCEHVNAMRDRLAANVAQVKSKLLSLMDDSDVTLKLTSRGKQIREGFESIIAKQGVMTYWDDRVQELKGNLKGIDWEAELRVTAPGVEDSNIEKQKEKEMEHFFRVATGVKSDLQLVQLWYNKMKAFDDTFQWLKQTADLAPDDVYPLRFGQQGMTDSVRTPRSEGNISVSYGTPSDEGQVNHYEIDVDGSYVAMSSSRRSSRSGISMEGQGSLEPPNAPNRVLWVPTANGLSIIGMAESIMPASRASSVEPGTDGSQIHTATSTLAVPGVDRGSKRRRSVSSRGSSGASFRPPTKRTALQGPDIDVDDGEHSDSDSAKLSISTQPGSMNTGL